MINMNENSESQKTEDEEQRRPVSIDRLIHEPARYNIMANLCAIDNADFLFLLRKTGLTWGNLSAHLNKLEAAGYIEIKKEILDKKPHTLATITQKGQLAFQAYRLDMIRILCILPSSE